MKTITIRKSMLYIAYFLGTALALPSSHQGQSFSAHDVGLREPLRYRDPVQDKNFYLLSLLEETPATTDLLARDPGLSSIAARKLSIETECSAQVSDCVKGAEFSHQEMTIVAERLEEDFRTNPESWKPIIALMRESGLFELYDADQDSQLLSQAWIDAAQGINHLLAVYGEGQAPRYPKIDSSSFNLDSVLGHEKLDDEFSSQISTISNRHTHRNTELWFQPSLQLALFLLKVNHRDEAGRFEPLDRGENAATLKRVRRVQWKNYRYSAIIVPGSGPEQAGVSLDPGGLLRVAIAAKHYRAGWAPFIIVSGGFVHPAQTPFCEAIEMKKALITKFGIPGNAVLVEPQARHTTTNLRNASRLLYRYGFPLDIPALISTDNAQTRDIRSTAFISRTITELGYVPFRRLTAVTPTDTAFFVETDSLQADSSDPLDP